MQASQAVLASFTSAPSPQVDLQQTAADVIATLGSMQAFGQQITGKEGKFPLLANVIAEQQTRCHQAKEQHEEDSQTNAADAVATLNIQNLGEALSAASLAGVQCAPGMLHGIQRLGAAIAGACLLLRAPSCGGTTGTSPLAGGEAQAGVARAPGPAFQGPPARQGMTPSCCGSTFGPEQVQAQMQRAFGEADNVVQRALMALQAPPPNVRPRL